MPAVASGPAAGLAIEKLGRRMSMLLLTIPFLAGGYLSFSLMGVTMILVGRFITGFCSGVYAVAAPIFTAEMADVSIRGTLCAGFDMMISVGILLIYIYGAFVSWRMQALISAILPVIIFVMMLFVPESPRYLVQKGKTLEATSALLRFRGAYFKEQVDPELRVLKNQCEEQSREIMWVEGSYAASFFSGIDPVLFYTVDIFSSSGANIDEYYSTIIIGSVQVNSANDLRNVNGLLTRRFGLLLFSQTTKRRRVARRPWLATLTSLIIYVVAYSIGVGPVGYMIMGKFYHIT
ncbi:Facilitated trehalose transporter Tret1-2 [Orchesella cincta]|uniref:Facilitated trehalose transporter Tret1-2 n=1 Tax=Orchesella cincta TaxID=48709 RepID=A0A1D2MIY0_ORCCI|nr:Facilitated trehalose transporter Tret1-2 [Orchesella cincta]